MSVDYKKPTIIGPQNVDVLWILSENNKDNRIIIPNMSGNIPDSVAADVLKDAILSKGNPFGLDTIKMQRDERVRIYKKYLDLFLPISPGALYADYAHIQRTKNVCISEDIVDHNRLPIYGVSDHYKHRFMLVNMLDENYKDWLVNNIIPFMIIKIYLKDGSVIFRLMIDVKNKLIENEDNTAYIVVPAGYSSVSDFGPVKNKTKNYNLVEDEELWLEV